MLVMFLERYLIYHSKTGGNMHFEEKFVVL